MDAHTVSSDASVKLRPEAFTREALAELGWSSATAAARAVGVSSSTLRRAIAGDIAPGERLIAALIAGSGKSFDDLFIVTV
jgi:lambda repressor-like predicted transcriptional regulator